MLNEMRHDSVCDLPKYVQELACAEERWNNIPEIRAMPPLQQQAAIYKELLKYGLRCLDDDYDDSFWVIILRAVNVLLENGQLIDYGYVGCVHYYMPKENEDAKSNR